ncbi:MAG TPA: sulfatase-like hydrolase/transferase [Acidobacteriota bacterium]
MLNVRLCALCVFVVIPLLAAPPQSKPDIILITIDTLRADHLGCYGYPGIETPNIDRLARDGVRFAQAVSNCPITLPSHASILTGTLPLYHGVRDNSGYRLPARLTTLAEVLKQQGYRTGAFVGAYVVNARTGLNQGFDTYVEGLSESGTGQMNISIAEQRASRVMANAVAWLRKSAAPQRSFAWIHLFDPHAPYDPPSPWAARYARHPYDGEIAYVDSVIGTLIRFLQSRNLYSSTLIVLSSDHGEGLGDHAESTHGLFLYDSTLRVPLIFKLPGSDFAGTVVADQVQSIDIFPTILQLLNLPKPAPVQGAGQLAAIRGKRTGETRFALGETVLPFEQYGWSPLASIRSQDYKYIQAPRPELYLLNQDPGERSNTAAGKSALASQLKELRRSLATQFTEKDTSEARVRVSDPQEFQRLLGLGYAALTAPVRPDPDISSFPDPKDKAAVFDAIWSAADDSEGKRYAQAVAKLQQVIRTDPKVYFARALLGVCYFQMGDFRQAAQELRTALSLRPQDLISTFFLGMSLARLGDHAVAQQAFLQVLELDPENQGALNNLGIVYLNSKRFAESAQIYLKLVRLRADDSFAWTNLGLAYMGMNRNGEAADVLRKAAKLSPAVPQIHNNLGLALMNSGQVDDAIGEYRRALALDAGYAQAHYNLAIALKRKGLDVEAEREMKIARRLFEKR